MRKLIPIVLLWVVLMIKLLTAISDPFHLDFFLLAIFTGMMGMLCLSFRTMLVKAPYALLMFAGGLFNFLAEASNGLMMPVYPVIKNFPLVDGQHIPATALTRFPYLCDHFALFNWGIYSIGDAVLLAGGLLWLGWYIKGVTPPFRRGDQE